MLQVASFKITDAAGINELLTSYRLASAAHILVSEGVVCIPYEDGEPENPAQQIVAIKEDKNKLIKELGILTHSQRVNDLQIADAKDELNVATAAWDKARSNKDLEAKKKADGRLIELENLYLMNKAEIVRWSATSLCITKQSRSSPRMMQQYQASSYGRPTYQIDARFVRNWRKQPPWTRPLKKSVFTPGLQSQPTTSGSKQILNNLTELRSCARTPILKTRTTIIKAISNNPNTAAWYLERKRKKEFAERKELTGQDGEPLFDDKEAKEKGKSHRRISRSRSRRYWRREIRLTFAAFSLRLH